MSRAVISVVVGCVHIFRRIELSTQSGRTEHASSRPVLDQMNARREPDLLAARHKMVDEQGSTENATRTGTDARGWAG